ncbi:MAG: hypothetical protein ACK4TF_03500 [Thermodesulfovibrionales bacterium]
MKGEKEYRNIICKKFCSYYKPDKEEYSGTVNPRCGAFKFLKTSLTPEELKGLIKGKLFVSPLFDQKDLCQRCDFRFNDCDFYAGLSQNPCGGYRIIETLKHR